MGPFWISGSTLSVLLQTTRVFATKWNGFGTSKDALDKSKNALKKATQKKDLTGSYMFYQSF